MFFNDIWLGFLCDQIIRRSEEMSKIKCPGCEAKLKSPVLHLHLQNSLLDKMRMYFEDIRGPVLESVPNLYQKISHKLPHSDDLEQDKESYIMIGRQFLISHTCDSMYYGRYVTQYNDSIVNEGFKILGKRGTASSSCKRRTKKKAAEIPQRRLL